MAAAMIKERRLDANSRGVNPSDVPVKELLGNVLISTTRLAMRAITMISVSTDGYGKTEKLSTWRITPDTRMAILPWTSSASLKGSCPPLDSNSTDPLRLFGMDVHLVDGTYELFRHYYALPFARDQDGHEVAAVRGVLRSVLSMIRGGATHIAVATDHVIESFRNGLWAGYKTGDGIEADLWAQFDLLEHVLPAAGVVVWPMVEFEADDALAAAAAAAAQDARVDRVIICTPDKDLAQCVRGTRIVQLNRRTDVTLDEEGVLRKFGVLPASIPDYLALVGDAADGYPGLPGWGPKSSAAVLSKFGHLEAIPADWHEWHVNATNAGALAQTLSSERDRAFLFRTIATLRTDIPLFDDVDELRWNGPGTDFEAVGKRLDAAVTSPKVRSRSA
jgi:5'-3' exonuclease